MSSPIPQNRRKTTFYLDPATLDRLADLREETGAPVAELVRRAVEEHLARRDAQAETSLVYAVEEGCFIFSAMLKLPKNDVLISGKFQNNRIDASDISGFPISTVNSISDAHIPLSRLLTAHERQTVTLATIIVANNGLSGELTDIAGAIRVAEIKTKICDAIRGAK